MFAKNLVQSGSTLQGKFGVDVSGYTYGFKTSSEYIIRNSIKLQFKVVANRSCYLLETKYPGHQHTHHNIYVRVDKVRKDDDIHVVRISSNKLEIVTTFSVSSVKGTWRLLRDSENNETLHCSFDMKISLIDYIKRNDSRFASLHEDTELTDFELRGEDGSVHVHRFALASSSPVLRRMLSGSWKEKTEGVVDLPGTTRASLQAFKDFIYLGTLPSTGLDNLLALSGCYMMPDLERKCVVNLRENLTAQNACDYFKLAVKHNLNNLMLEVLHFVRTGDIKVDEIETCLFLSD